MLMRTCPDQGDNDAKRDRNEKPRKVYQRNVVPWFLIRDKTAAFIKRAQNTHIGYFG
jgi:hypothetical protein